MGKLLGTTREGEESGNEAQSRGALIQQWLARNGNPPRWGVVDDLADVQAAMDDPENAGPMLTLDDVIEELGLDD